MTILGKWKEGWPVSKWLSHLKSGEGIVRAETVYGPCFAGEQPSEEKQLPKAGEAGSRKPQREVLFN